MYKLRRKKWLPPVPKRYIFFTKLVGVSVGVHIIIACCLFVGMKPSGVTSYSVVLNQKALPTNIVLLPLVKKVSGALVAVHEQQKKAPSNIKVPKTPKPKAATTLAQKKEPPKQVKKVTSVPPPKKLEPKKSAPVVAKKEVTQPTKQQPKKQEKLAPKPNKPQIAQTQKPPQRVQPPVVKKQQQSVKNEVIYLGRDDLAALVTHERIQKHIERVWRPPVGVSKDCVCIINVTIDDTGIIHELTIEESSKVLPYDIAARTAIMQVPFPKGMWGKNLVVTFKQ